MKNPLILAFDVQGKGLIDWRSYLAYLVFEKVPRFPEPWAQRLAGMDEREFIEFYVFMKEPAPKSLSERFTEWLQQ